MGLLQLTSKAYRENKGIIGRYELQKQFVPLSVSYMHEYVSLRSKSRRFCDIPCAKS